MRLYACDNQGIISLAAMERRGWQPEAGVRLAGGSEPAVARLTDGSFLMLYSVSSQQSAGGAALVENSSSDKIPAAIAQGGADGSDAGAWQSFASGASGAAVNQADDSAAASGETTLPPLADLVAPLPKAGHEIDYYAWLTQRFPVPAEGNAYDVYAQIMHTPDDYLEPKPGWPAEIDDMFNGEYNGKPFPWNPAEYPNWEASNQNMQSLLDTFRQASLVEAYVDPLKPSAEQAANASETPTLLVEILLPSLADHRKLVKATLADGWRAENGQVEPERMLNDVETVLRAASHFQQGPTLIHRLVGIAEQAAAQATAREALAQVPFTAEQLETGLQILQQHDRGPVDPAGFIPAETAMTMQLMQELLEPAEPSIDNVTSFFGFVLPRKPTGNSMQDQIAELRRLGPTQAQSAAEALQQHYPRLGEQFRTGYPQVTARDVKTLNQQFMKTNTVTQTFVPALDRAYLLNARNETGRRGTQLAWAVHLFHARNGRWPASLDELPADGSKMRTDPFSGRDFVYQLTQTGPTIYSSSENGTDDGGVHSSKWGDEESVKETGGSDDYVFWPPK